jgi:hypothetical protein
MKYSKTVLIVFLFSLSVVYAQPDVMMIPVANQSEHTVAAIDENNLLLIYNKRNLSLKKDSLFYKRTTDAGISWSSPVLINVISSLMYPSSYLLNSGRILLGWTVNGEGIFISYSDDNALTWSDPVLVREQETGLTTRPILYPQFSEKPNGEVYLSFVNSSKTSALYIRSFDQGNSWENEPTEYLDFSMLNFTYIEDASLFSYDNNLLLVVYEIASPGFSSHNIYLKYSTDNGNSWGDSVIIDYSYKNKSRPRIVKTNNNTLWIIYQVEDTLSIDFANTFPNNLFYVKSTDGGVSWSEPHQLTKYLRDDSFISTSRYTDKPFLIFRTQRFLNEYSSSTGYNLAFMIPEITVEKFTPPVISEYRIEFTEHKDTLTTFTVKAFDDISVSKVYLRLTDGKYLELFDDGNHYDGEAGDSIYGNKVPFNYLYEDKLGGMFINNIKMPLSNNGQISNFDLIRIFADTLFVEDNMQTRIARSDSFGIKSRLANYDGVPFLYSGGFLLTGYNNNTLWANGEMIGGSIANYLPGFVGSDTLDSRNKLYSVYADDIPFGSSWQNWREAVSLGADFYDGDGDGIYNPVDLNYNGIWDPDEDMPDLIGDKTIWCVFNDGRTNRVRFAGVEPLGIEIQQTVFASSLPDLENVVFFRYRIINRGTAAEKLDSVIISILNDFDVGYDFGKDLFASDTLLQSAYVYKKAEDFSYGYGANPPAFFNTLLQGPVVIGNASDTAVIKRGPQIGINKIPGKKNLPVSSSINLFYKDNQNAYPAFISNARNFALGLHPYGDLYDPCSDPYGEILGNINCASINPKFKYSGDPVSGIGWINSRTSDQIVMLSVGPFDLVKDEPVEIIFAYVAGRGADRLNSITVARDNVQKAIDEYLSNFSSLAYKPGEPSYVIDNYELFQNYPNPFNPFTTIRYDLLEDGLVSLKVFDILGQEVKTLVNSFQPTRRYEVQFNSEGLASGVYIYRLQINDFSQSKKMIILR